MVTARDPLAMSRHVEAVRLQIRQVGPPSGWHGPAAADIDRKLSDVVEYLQDIAKRLDERKREART